ncbi:MAG: DNA gyrase subunit A, partial [Muribaculaceae bacterium]|nr:DNA gyrase subunit A [Muribaculaceae bacterium]
AMGRVSAGVRGMRLDEDGEDAVVGLITMEANSSNSVMTLSEKGYGKRSDLDGYRTTNRGGKGVKTMNITDKTGHLVAFESVNDDNDLVIINESGITIRIHVADLRVMGRATQGVKIINLEKRNDCIASVCCVDSDPEEEVQQIVEGEELPEMESPEVESEELETESDDEVSESTDL